MKERKIHIGICSSATPLQLPNAINAFATSPDGRLLLTGWIDGRVRVYNCDTPPYEFLCATTAECERIYTLAVCIDNEKDGCLLVVTGHRQWIVRCWRVDVAARQVRLEWVGNGTRDGKEYDVCYSDTVCISYDRQWVAASGYNFRCGGSEADDICLFPLVGDGSVARVIAGRMYAPGNLCFTPDDRFLVAGGSDMAIRVWSVETGEQLQCVRVDSSLRCMALLRGRSVLVTGYTDGGVRLWSIGQHTLIEEDSYHLPITTPVWAIRCAEDEEHVVLWWRYAGVDVVVVVSVVDSHPLLRRFHSVHCESNERKPGGKVRSIHGSSLSSGRDRHWRCRVRQR